jgi:hypothetical protein
LLPTRAFISVDFPTFGRPAKQANPDRNPGATGDGTAGEGERGDLTWRLSPSRALSC